MSRWLNPKKHPIPEEINIIAYIRIEENILSIKYRKIHEFVTCGQIINNEYRDFLNFEYFCDSTFTPLEQSTYDINCVIAWMHLPNPPRSKKHAKVV